MSGNSQKDIILQFKGYLDYDIIGELIGSLRDHMKLKKARYGLYKKLLTLLIEALENIVRYNLEVSSGNDIFINSPPELVICLEEGYYVLETRNLLLNKDIPPIDEKLASLNKIGKPKIRELYKATITDGKFSERGGAGLGFIEMAKTVDRRMDYSFTEVNDEISLFRLKLSILNSSGK